MRMVTVDSLDDDLVKRRQEQTKELQEKVLSLEDAVDSLAKQLGIAEDEIFSLKQENKDLKDKLLIYEHDPIIYESYGDGYIIKVWNKEENRYLVFANFFDIDFEEDLEEFCKEFVLELKDAYMVE